MAINYSSQSHCEENIHEKVIPVYGRLLSDFSGGSLHAQCHRQVVGDLKDGRGDDSKPIYMVLKQDGNKVAGSAGPNESEQHRFDGGKVEGSKVTFDVSLGGGPGSMHFDLQVEGDQIMGQVRRSREGLNETANISLKRVAEK